MSDKKGDILNQLAIVSDLLEKVNLESVNTTAFFELTEEEFDRILNYVNEKYGGQVEDDDSGTFSIVIGDIPFVFSKNSV